MENPSGAVAGADPADLFDFDIVRVDLITWPRFGLQWFAMASSVV